MGDLFAFEDVSLRKGSRMLLDRISIRIPALGITGVVGASGAGKSSLLRCCNRLEAPTAGVVRYRGHDVATLDPRRHRRRVGMVFQSPTTFPGTVMANLRAVRPDLDESTARAFCQRVGLDPQLLDQTADSLSGGEAQRLVVARALTTDPEVLLADEATSALDATATTRLEGLARRLADEGIPVVWVTHDLAQVQRLADWLIVMRQGRVCWSGRADAPEAGAAVEAALADVVAGEVPDDR